MCVINLLYLKTRKIYYLYICTSTLVTYFIYEFFDYVCLLILLVNYWNAFQRVGYLYVLAMSSSVVSTVNCSHTIVLYACKYRYEVWTFYEYVIMCVWLNKLMTCWIPTLKFLHIRFENTYIRIKLIFIIFYIRTEQLLFFKCT